MQKTLPSFDRTESAATAISSCGERVSISPLRLIEWLRGCRSVSATCLRSRCSARRCQSLRMSRRATAECPRATSCGIWECHVDLFRNSKPISNWVGGLAISTIVFCREGRSLRTKSVECCGHSWKNSAIVVGGSLQVQQKGPRAVCSRAIPPLLPISRLLSPTFYTASDNEAKLKSLTRMGGIT